MVILAMKLKDACSLKSYDKPRQRKLYGYNFNHIIKAMVFPVVMYECESWTVKKAEH